MNLKVDGIQNSLQIKMCIYIYIYIYIYIKKRVHMACKN